MLLTVLCLFWTAFQCEARTLRQAVKQQSLVGRKEGPSESTEVDPAPAPAPLRFGFEVELPKMKLQKQKCNGREWVVIKPNKLKESFFATNHLNFTIDNIGKNRCEPGINAPKAFDYLKVIEKGDQPGQPGANQEVNRATGSENSAHPGETVCRLQTSPPNCGPTGILELVTVPPQEQTANDLAGHLGNIKKTIDELARLREGDVAYFEKEDDDGSYFLEKKGDVTLSYNIQFTQGLSLRNFHLIPEQLMGRQYFHLLDRSIEFAQNDEKITDRLLINFLALWHWLSSKLINVPDSSQFYKNTISASPRINFCQAFDQLQKHVVFEKNRQQFLAMENKMISFVNKQKQHGKLLRPRERCDPLLCHSVYKKRFIDKRYKESVLRAVANAISAVKEGNTFSKSNEIRYCMFVTEDTTLVDVHPIKGEEELDFAVVFEFRSINDGTPIAEAFKAVVLRSTPPNADEDIIVKAFDYMQLRGDGSAPPTHAVPSCLKTETKSWQAKQCKDECRRIADFERNRNTEAKQEAQNYLADKCSECKCEGGRLVDMESEPRVSN